MNIGIIGCGAIGSRIASEIDNSFQSQIDSISLADIDTNRMENLKNKLATQVFIYKNYDNLIQKVDFVIECAGAHVSADIARKSLSSQKPVMLLSVGGLVSDPDLLHLSEEQKTNLFLPSGSIAGLDALSGMSLSTITKVKLTTKKPLHSVLNTPIWKLKNIDIASISEPFCLFEGSAREAIQLFPQNINVAVTLSLKTLGVDRTQVSIWVSPKWTTNSHEIEVWSNAGKLLTRMDNIPLPDNSSTSSLAFFSAIAVLKKYFSYTKIGV